MMYSEFLELSKQDITYQQYTEVIEPMYNAVEQMTKRDFINFMLPSIKALAKQNAATKVAAQPTVFISDGAKTPNGCYYLGKYGKLVDKDVSISTGKTTVKVRELTADEKYEVSRTWDLYLNSTVDYYTDDPSVKIRWVK
ncbi:MAG: hypothetical protein LIP12_09125 [Clostridiales bacterium]|nr:hypothetical protein [Clostridiales bacterium]